MHARHLYSRRLVDQDDLRVRMRRTEHLDVEQAFDDHIEGVACGAPYYLWSGGCGKAASEGGADDVIFDIGLAVERVFDGTVARAPADISLERRAEILPLCLVQR